jgi:hypothetical protein
MLQLSHAYAFIGGAFVGKFTGIIPSIIISGMMLYIADNTIFSVENITNSKDFVVSLVQKYQQSKM